jgi:hypothetical protein
VSLFGKLCAALDRRRGRDRSRQAEEVSLLLKLCAALDRSEGIALSAAELQDLAAMFAELVHLHEAQEKEINRWVQAAIEAKRVMGSGKGSWKGRAAEALRRLWILSTPGEARINMRAFLFGCKYRQLIESGVDRWKALERIAARAGSTPGAVRKLLQRNGVKGLPRDDDKAPVDK